jgi:hypothetical protein
MATPSSGPISWSQIQAVAGGAYSMSNFNAVSGRGYSASQYYNYSPPSPSCFVYQTYDFGVVSFISCSGISYSYFVSPGENFCASGFGGGPAYDTGIACL